MKTSTHSIALQTNEAWAGIPGIEISQAGRIFICWFTGGPAEPHEENRILVTWSDDDTKSFQPPQCLAEPDQGARAFDPCLWLSPTGEMWLFLNRGNRGTGVHEVHARICRNPDAPDPVWEPEFPVDLALPYCFRLNKPTVLSSGEWILPVTLATQKTLGWFAGPEQRQGVAISSDAGKTWSMHGCLEAPEWALENMIVEKVDGSLWMLIRTGSGFLWQSFSQDRGRTWTPATASPIATPGSRFFVRRLASGNLLLINHYKFSGNRSHKARSHLTAQISRDDGATWSEGLLLDERSSVSYPDAFQAKDGLIRMIYDRDRGGAGEILSATFCEEDALHGENKSGRVILRQILHRLEA